MINLPTTKERRPIEDRELRRRRRQKTEEAILGDMLSTPPLTNVTIEIGNLNVTGNTTMEEFIKELNEYKS